MEPAQLDCCIAAFRRFLTEAVFRITYEQTAAPGI